MSQKYLLTVRIEQSCPVTCQYNDVMPKGGKPIVQDLELPPQADEAIRAPVSPADTAVNKLRWREMRPFVG